VSKILLVTGGSRGIGAAIVRQAAPQGYDVAINYLRDAAAADALSAEVRAAGRRAITIQGDMAQEADVDRTFKAMDTDLGRLTHLVYNAGTTGGYSRLEDADNAMMRNVLELNVLGALMCVKAAATRMSAKKGEQGGAIVLISSMAATLGSAGEYVWYAASKGAVDTMTVGLSRELAADNIRVNAVSPGLIDTTLHPPGRLERLAPMMPIPRAGTPEEVAAAVMFLLSEASSYTTGTNIRVAGGR
jgi:NAD(P)-dependent dehydrogenase (short-subunit alcohol dehydrogenase family)